MLIDYVVLALVVVIFVSFVVLVAVGGVFAFVVVCCICVG